MIRLDDRMYRYCVWCGKRIFVSSEYVYKRTPLRHTVGNRYLYFCSYTHMRDWDRMIKPREEALKNLRIMRPRVSSLKNSMKLTKPNSNTMKKAREEVEFLLSRITEYEDTVEKVDAKIREFLMKPEAFEGGYESDGIGK